MSTPRITLDDRAFRAKLRGAVEAGVRQAAAWLAYTQVKSLINIGNRAGDNPSRPGEPPHKVTARLQKSIEFAVRAEGETITAQIGSNVVYAPTLERGFSGTVRVPGRTVRSHRRKSRQGKAYMVQAYQVRAHTRRMMMAPRPYLQPSLRANAEAFTRIVVARVRRAMGGR